MGSEGSRSSDTSLSRRSRGSGCAWGGGIQSCSFGRSERRPDNSQGVIDMDRVSLIKQSAERARLRTRRKPTRRPMRTSARWVRSGSATMTVYGASRGVLYNLIRQLIEEQGSAIDEGEHVKTHIQLFEKKRRD